MPAPLPCSGFWWVYHMHALKVRLHAWHAAKIYSMAVTSV